MHIKNKFLLSILIVQPFTLMEASERGPEGLLGKLYYCSMTAASIVSVFATFHQFYYSIKEKPQTLKQMQKQLEQLQEQLKLAPVQFKQAQAQLEHVQAQVKLAQGQCSEQEATFIWKKEDRETTQQHMKSQAGLVEAQRLEQVQSSDWKKDDRVTNQWQQAAQLNATNAQSNLTKAQCKEQEMALAWKIADRKITQQHMQSQAGLVEAQRLEQVQASDWKKDDRETTQQHAKAQLQHTQAQVKLAPVQFEHVKGQCAEQKISIERAKNQQMLELHKLQKEVDENPEHLNPKKIKDLETLETDAIIQQYMRNAWNVPGKPISEDLKAKLKRLAKVATEAKRAEVEEAVMAERTAEAKNNSRYEKETIDFYEAKKKAILEKPTQGEPTN